MDSAHEADYKATTFGLTTMSPLRHRGSGTI